MKIDYLARRNGQWNAVDSHTGMRTHHLRGRQDGEGTTGAELREVHAKSSASVPPEGATNKDVADRVELWELDRKQTREHNISKSTRNLNRNNRNLEGANKRTTKTSHLRFNWGQLELWCLFHNCGIYKCWKCLSDRMWPWMNHDATVNLWFWEAILISSK